MVSSSGMPSLESIYDDSINSTYDNIVQTSGIPGLEIEVDAGDDKYKQSKEEAYNMLNDLSDLTTMQTSKDIASTLYNNESVMSSFSLATGGEPCPQPGCEGTLILSSATLRSADEASEDKEMCNTCGKEFINRKI
tara:strand:- start:2392 stop:2799 length:408 start_codon:yes stop_codon:yes gene_type:complete